MGRNGEVIKGVYDAFARGDVASVLGAFDGQIHWMEAENFLYADRNPYMGPQAVAEGVFQRIITNVDGFSVLLSTSLMGATRSWSRDAIVEP
jgi:uncharacterized protein